MGPVWENKGTIALPTDLSVAVTVVIGRSSASTYLAGIQCQQVSNP